MVTDYGFSVTFSSSTTGFSSELEPNGRCEEVIGLRTWGCRGTYPPSSAIIYATTEANANQMTDDNKIATVAFNGSGFNVQGVVTMLDNGKKFSGKRYVGIKTPSSYNGTFIVTIHFDCADTMKVKTGSGFQECFPMLYNGTEFVPCLVNRYDGTAFEECTHIVYET